MSGVSTFNISHHQLQNVLIRIRVEVETPDIGIYLYHYSVPTATDDDLFV